MTPFSGAAYSIFGTPGVNPELAWHLNSIPGANTTALGASKVYELDFVPKGGAKGVTFQGGFLGVLMLKEAARKPKAAAGTCAEVGATVYSVSRDWAIYWVDRRMGDEETGKFLTSRPHEFSGRHRFCAPCRPP